MAVRITIAGDIGSGKTTVARTVAERLRVEPLSTGGIQRQLAMARGITTLELNRLAETDGSIDEEIDNYLKRLPAGDLVVESRMAWHFVPYTRNIFLYIVRHKAAQRILVANRNDEVYQNLGDATTYIARRRQSEVLRFEKYYSVNIDDLRNYDLLIDTSFRSPGEIAHNILTHGKLNFRPTILLDPRNLVPTQGIRDLNPHVVEQILEAIRSRGFDHGHAISTIYVNHTFYITDGHNRVAAAIKAGIDFVPLKLLASEDEDYISGLSARSYVRDSVSDSGIYDWEDVVGFKYEYPIWRVSSPPSKD